VGELTLMFEGYDYPRLFPLITCPTLIIQGSPAHGGALSDEEVEQALALPFLRGDWEQRLTPRHG